jgi:hypothetical protein
MDWGIQEEKGLEISRRSIGRTRSVSRPLMTLMAFA